MINETPKIVKSSLDWLEPKIQKSWKVFEWGTGYSTVYWAKKVAEVISVEDTEKWRDKVVKLLEDKQLENYTIHLILPDDLPVEQHIIHNKVAERLAQDPENYMTKHSLVSTYESYVKKIDSFSDEYFDLIFIDGRARASCIKHAIDKLRAGGYLVLDNSDRTAYNIARRLIKGWESISFYGQGVTSKLRWTTTIFTKPNIKL